MSDVELIANRSKIRVALRLLSSLAPCLFASGPCFTTGQDHVASTQSVR